VNHAFTSDKTLKERDVREPCSMVFFTGTRFVLIPPDGLILAHSLSTLRMIFL
jgi:hypothetical protein